MQPVGEEHFPDGLEMTLWRPALPGVLVNDIEVFIGIKKAEEEDGVMGVAVIHGGDPFDSIGFLNLGDDMDAMIEGFEKLACLNVPVSVEP